MLHGETLINNGTRARKRVITENVDDGRPTSSEEGDGIPLDALLLGERIDGISSQITVLNGPLSHSVLNYK